jgi:large subunit ribosomal protein L25
MSNTFTFNASVRSKVGKGASRADRLSGLVPATIYGDAKTPISVLLNPKELMQQLVKGGIYTNIYSVAVDKNQVEVLVRSVQFHPVKDTPMHVDMLRIGEKTVTRIGIPLNFTNQAKSQGLKFGGILNIVTHTLEVAGNPKNAPHAIEVDLGETRVGSVIKIEDIKLPNGFKTYYPKGFAIASVTANTNEEDKSKVATTATAPAASKAAPAKAAAAPAKPAAKK